MKVLIQRVSEASVRVSDREVSTIGRGLLIFLGVAKNDGEPQLEVLVKKLTGFRLFVYFGKQGRVRQRGMVCLQFLERHGLYICKELGIRFRSGCFNKND